MPDERSAQDRIEALIEEEHRLWQGADERNPLSEDDRQRLELIRTELDACYESLRRRRAGAPDREKGVPWPPNDLDEPPYEEPPHLERGGAREDVPAPDPDIPSDLP